MGGPFVGGRKLPAMQHPLSGVYAAAPTPLAADLSPSPGDMAALLSHLRRVGCHGALVLGTTGEGPALGLDERRGILEAAAEWRAGHPEFRLLAGTGCAALPEAIALTRFAVELGYDAQVVLPAFYYKAVGPEGLVDWFLRVADGAGAGARIFLYHIPAVSGVAVPLEVVERLLEAAPGVVVGIKDSSGDMEHTRALCRLSGLAVFTGNDRHLADCLAAGGAGAVTALANVCGDLARSVYEGGPDGDMTRLAAARQAFDAYPSIAAVKGLLAYRFGLPRWPVRPPLTNLPGDAIATLSAKLDGVLGGQPALSTTS